VALAYSTPPQNLALNAPVYRNYRNNVVKISDWIKGEERAVENIGYGFADNPEGTFSWAGFGQAGLEFSYYPLEAHRRIVVMSGSIRGGKTTAMIPKWMNYCASKPKGLKAIVGVSKDTIYQNILSDMFLYFDCFNIKYKYNQSSGYLNVKFGPNDKDWFTCKVIGSKDKGSVKYLRGVTLSGAYVDELTFVNQTFFKELLGRCSVEGSKIFCTTNPDSPTHWVYKDFVKPDVNEDVEVWTFLLTDNPTLSKEYIDFICRQWKGTFYERYIMGRWIAADGLVYSTFNKTKHVVSHSTLLKWLEANEDARGHSFADFFFGLDWGWEHPTAIALYCVTTGGTYYQIDELKESHFDHVNAKRWIKAKQLEFKKYFRFGNCDNARPEQNVKMAQEWTIYSDKPDVIDSIGIVRELINFDRVILSDRCVHTIEELQTYRYPNKDDIIKLSTDIDKPIKEYDDLMDAMRYGLVYYEVNYGSRFKHIKRR